MNAIVAVNQDWAIGYRNRLLVKNREDMRHFVACTKPGTVIMGRATFESFPSGALPDRRNIIVSKTMTSSDVPDGCELATSPEEALELCSAAGSDPDHVWLIGGAQLYKAMLHLCRRAYVTFHHTTTAADSYFPNLDEMAEWKLVEESELQKTAEGIAFNFRVYERISK